MLSNSSKTKQQNLFYSPLSDMLDISIGAGIQPVKITINPKLAIVQTATLLFDADLFFLINEKASATSLLMKIFFYHKVE